jgi:ATP-dependent Clp protease adapter protein ClpS
MSQHHADLPHPQENRRGTLPAYQVVLHQDPRYDLMFVVRTVMELTRLCRAEATHKMWEAHHSGRSVLLVTYRERAELYAEQFQERGLLVSVEPA